MVMTRNDKKRRFQVCSGVLQGNHDRRPEEIAGDADHEQFSESCVKHQLGRNPAVAATHNRGIGLLALCQFCEHIFLHVLEAGVAGNESRVSFLEARERFLCRVGRRLRLTHDFFGFDGDLYQSSGFTIFSDAGSIM